MTQSQLSQLLGLNVHAVNRSDYDLGKIAYIKQFTNGDIFIVTEYTEFEGISIFHIESEDADQVIQNSDVHTIYVSTEHILDREASYNEKWNIYLRPVDYAQINEERRKMQQEINRKYVEG